MDNYLLEQQEQLAIAKRMITKNFLLKIFILLIIWLGIVVAINLIMNIVDLLFKTQDVDKYPHTEIVFKGQLIMSNGKGTSESHLIQDEDGNRYHVSEEQYDRVSTQLVSGSTYEMIYCQWLFGNKYVRLLKDASQTYISLNEREDFFQGKKLFVIRLKTLGKCMTVSIGLAFICLLFMNLIDGIKEILLYKKRICYYSSQGIPPPAEILESKIETKPASAIEYDSLTAEEVPQVLQQELLVVQNKYMSDKRETLQGFLTAIFLFGGAGVVLYTCLLGLLTAGTPTKTEWQTGEIVFEEISKESYYENQGYYCICDQEGNKYALTSSSEYRYYDLKEQLQKGQSYQIEYGVNKYLNKDIYNLYQLSNNSVTYVPSSEALTDIHNNQNHQKKLNVFCLLWNVLIIVFMGWGEYGKIKKEKQLIFYCKGRIIFYQHTGIVLLPPTELYAEEEEERKAEDTNTTPTSMQSKVEDVADGEVKNKPVFKKHETINSFMTEEELTAKQTASMAEFYQQRFAERELIFLLAGLILAIVGGINAYKGLALWQAPQNTSWLFIVALLLQGSLMSVFGLWLMFIFRRRTVEIPEGAIVAYESKSELIGGWTCYLAIMAIAVLCYCFTADNLYNYADFIRTMLLVIVPLYFAFLLFGCHRNRRLILTEETIERVTFLGQKSYYERNDVAGMKKAGLRLKILNANGRKMFSLRPSMVQAKEIFFALGGDKYYKYESNDYYADK